MISNKMRRRIRQLWKKEIQPVLVLALIVFSIRSSLADWNDVPTGSMKPTIVEGDRIFVNKLAYDLKVPFTTRHLAEWSNPHRGDIVVFYSPHDGKRLVKRVIGLPGDTLELRNDVLVLNGAPLDYGALDAKRVQDVEPNDKLTHTFAQEMLPGRTHAVASYPGVPARRDFGPVVVPEGEYFMMGDNRDDSFDSRYYGAVERKRILGRATFIAMSLDRKDYYYPRWDRWFTALDPKS
ncbi:MAG TPA: signal peptidase I [Candidatus Dormibacteraeota bacterium]|nr:signal peptidase I [Candidatus Dormibacteraeota bacterium]